MNPTSLSPVANHLWQSTIVAVLAGVLTLVLRNNRARVRQYVWVVASWKFLIPVSLLVSLGGHIQWRTGPEITQSNLSVAIERVSQPFPGAAASASRIASPQPAPSPIPAVLWGIWACGALGFSYSWWVRWQQIRRAVRSGSPIDLAVPIPVVCSPELREPGVFGVFRPVLMLPEGIFECLTPGQLKAVVAHELSHIGHRDNLVAAVHMFVETVFWFHPAVWWIGKRIVEERERACDEEVLRLGSEPRAYAEGILNVCKLYAESPLTWVSGVGGPNLRKRITWIMKNRTTARLSFAKKTLLAIIGTATLVLPVILGIPSSPVRAQTRHDVLPGAARPKFEVASMKGCRVPDSETGNRQGGGSRVSSPVTLDLPCETVRTLIRIAYIRSNFRSNGGIDNLGLEGGPSWIDSERYQISAKATRAVGQAVMEGPMLQDLLEDRLHLKTHQETREAPLYALTVAKTGLKIKPSVPGSCVQRDSEQESQEPPKAGDQPYCGELNVTMGPRRIKYDVASGTMTQLAQNITARLGRPGIDRTGITEKFDFHLEFAPEGADSANDLGLPSIFSVLDHLGLKLESVRGPRQFLVIDHIERPAEN